MTKTVTIHGERIHDIRTFYEEINRVFMANEDWKLGPSLDALDDMLYGGFGAIAGNEPINLVWIAFDRNKEDLGLEQTRSYYLDKLSRPTVFDTGWVKEKLAALENGQGKTYFEIVLEIIAGHGNIHLIPE